MQPILVPTINSNDTDALLVSWSKTDGEAVQRGETIAMLETTKANFELFAEGDGVLQISAVPGKRYDFGATLGWLFADAAEREKASTLKTETAVENTGDLVITKAAQEVIEKHAITRDALLSLGKKIIKAADLDPLLKSGPANESTIRPDAQQLTIARTVSRSRNTIPDAFLLKKIRVDAALAALGDFSREEKAMTGIPDLLIWIAARLTGDFPFFFGALKDDLHFVPSKSGNIGVTFDLGTGLFIPVIRNASTLSLHAIAKQMMGFRMRAMRNRFQAEDLMGGDLSISINMDADVLMVQPIILPPQTCMLSLSAVLHELVLENGNPTQRSFIQLGAAYDHRVINGFQANAFLNAIKQQFETPDPGTWRAAS